MKRFLLILTLITALLLTSCGGNASDNGNADKQDGGKDSKYFFKAVSADNYYVKIDADMADVLKALGEPLSYFEAASCAFDGLDKTYTYSGFEICTRPDGDKDYVNSIRLTDDSVTTSEGIYIGCTVEDVLEKYGDGTNTATLISYTDNNTTLNFILQNGIVVSIEYLPV